MPYPRQQAKAIQTLRKKVEAGGGGGGVSKKIFFGPSGLSLV